MQRASEFSGDEPIARQQANSAVARSAARHGHPVVAALLDFVMWPVRSVRADVVPMARGHVLKVGIGTGSNLPFYEEADSVTGIDPDPHMLKRARKRARRLGLAVELFQDEAEDLPFEDNAFDTVVATWVLCTVTYPERALAEVRRVLKPDGLFVYAEHTRSRFSLPAKLQKWLTPIWTRCAAGCHLDRDTIAMIRQAGFTHVTKEAVGGEKWILTPIYRGTGRG